MSGSIAKILRRSVAVPGHCIQMIENLLQTIYVLPQVNSKEVLADLTIANGFFTLWVDPYVPVGIEVYVETGGCFFDLG